MNNQQLIEEFTHNPHTRQSTPSGNLSIANKVLWSYDTPIAFYQEDTGFFLVSLHKYSRTTSRHQSTLVRYLEFAGFIFITTSEEIPS